MGAILLIAALLLAAAALIGAGVLILFGTGCTLVFAGVACAGAAALLMRGLSHG